MKTLVDKQIEIVEYGNSTTKYFVNFVYNCTYSISLFNRTTTERDKMYFLTKEDAIAYAKYASCPSKKLNILSYDFMENKYEALKKYDVFDLGEVYSVPFLNYEKTSILESPCHLVYIVDTEFNIYTYTIIQVDHDEDAEEIIIDKMVERLWEDEWGSRGFKHRYYHGFETFDDAIKEAARWLDKYSSERVKCLEDIKDSHKLQSLKKTVVSSSIISVGKEHQGVMHALDIDVSKDNKLINARNELIRAEIERIDKMKQLLLTMIM